MREQLDKKPSLTEVEREDLHKLMQQIEFELELETKTQDVNLADNVNMAVERFELEHPTLSDALRRIGTALHSMGI